MGNYPVIDTIGIEIETETMVEENLRSISNFCHGEHDASIESNAVSLGNFIVKETPSLGDRRRIVIGREIVTVPLDSTSPLFEERIELITDLLHKCAEPEESYRSGIHIHVGMSYNLRILKAILRLGIFTEQLFFNLGGMGYTFRGMKVNDSAYCRPITKFGPPCIYGKSGKFHFQIFNVLDLLKSNTNIEFWERYGDINYEEYNNGGGVNRYHPARYTWLNVYSLLYHGTLEFRVFNKTLNPAYIVAVIELCKKFSEFCLNSDYKTFETLGLLEEHSIFDNYTKEDVLLVLSKLNNIFQFTDKTMFSLRQILKRSPLVKLDSEYIESHLIYGRNRPRTNFWYGSDYKPNPIEEYKKPNFIDIHTINGDR